MVVLGDSKIGKTSMIEGFVNERPCLQSPQLPSQGQPRLRTKQIAMADGRRVNLQI